MATTPGASGSTTSTTTSTASTTALGQATAAVDSQVAQVQNDLNSALKMAEALFDQAQKTAGVESDSLRKKAQILTKISEQQAEMLKIAQDMKKIEADLVLKEEEKKKLKGDAKDVAEKETLALRQQLLLKQSANEEARKAAISQKEILENLGKQEGALGKIFALGKNSIVQYIAGIATLSSAISNYKRSLTDVLDVSALSGNYEALSGGMTHALASATKFQMGMAESQTGLRLLGYTTEEVNSSFKDFSVLGARVGGALNVEQIANMTVVTGRLSKLLGVSLPEATQHVIQMQQRFGATASQTAQALLDIQDATQKYNDQVGRTVIVGRDVAKVLFDIGRESKGAAVDQGYLTSVLTSNLLLLQKQGLNYQEALEQSSLYVRKLTAEAPDWVQIMAGQNLQKQIKLIGGSLSESMKAQLEAARPGLSTRIEKIMKETSGYAQTRAIQEALSTTKLGMDAAGKVIDQVLKGRTESDAVLVIAAINHISVAQAKSLVDQRKGQKALEDDVARLSAMKQEDAAKEIQRRLGVSKQYAMYLTDQKNGTALELALQQKVTDDAANATKENDAQAKKVRDEKVADLKKQQEAAKAGGAEDLANDLQKQINKLDDEAGLNDEAKKTAAKTEAIQGGPVFEALDLFWTKYLASPMGKLVLGVGLLAGKEIIGGLIGIPNTLSQMKGVFDAIKGLRGGAAVATEAAEVGTVAAEGTAVAGTTVAATTAATTGTVAAEAGTVAAGTGAAATGLATTVGAASVLALATTALAGAGAGVLIGSVINMIDSKTGGHISKGVQNIFSATSKLFGGKGIETDAEVQSKAEEKFRADFVKRRGFYPEALTAQPKPVVAATAVAALPAPQSGPGNIVGGQQGQSGQSSQPSGQPGQDNGITSSQSGQIIPSATGADYEITTTHRIPMAQIHAYNMNVASKGVKSPTGS